MQVSTINREGKIFMKKVIVSTIACGALVAPLALAKDQNAKNHGRPWHFAFVTERPVTITAPSPHTSSIGGATAAYQPPKTLVVQHDGVGRFVLDEPGHVFNGKGEVVRTKIHPGTRVQVYFAADQAGMKTIDRIVVD
jgi:hypothetical protein